MRKVYVFPIYGLGGWFFGSYVRAFANWADQLEGVEVPGIYSRGSERAIAKEIDRLRGAEPEALFIVAGQSMGAATATRVTDWTYVDGVVLFDIAGDPGSCVCKNATEMLDISDEAFDVVPDFDGNKCHEACPVKFKRVHSYVGHTPSATSAVALAEFRSLLNRLRK